MYRSVGLATAAVTLTLTTLTLVGSEWLSIVVGLAILAASAIISLHRPADLRDGSGTEEGVVALAPDMSAERSSACESFVAVAPVDFVSAAADIGALEDDAASVVAFAATGDAADIAVDEVEAHACPAVSVTDERARRRSGTRRLRDRNGDRAHAARGRE